jgi:hypothetical protein
MIPTQHHFLCLKIRHLSENTKRLLLEEKYARETRLVKTVLTKTRSPIGRTTNGSYDRSMELSFSCYCYIYLLESEGDVTRDFFIMRPVGWYQFYE